MAGPGRFRPVSPAKLALLCAVLLAFVSRAAAEDWKIIRSDGRDYVSFTNVAMWYQEQLGQAIAQSVATYNRAINFQNAGPMIASATTNHPPHTHTITESSGTRPTVSAKPAPARSPAAQAPN